MKQVLYVLTHRPGTAAFADGLRGASQCLDAGHQVLVFADVDAVEGGFERAAGSDDLTVSAELPALAGLATRGACIVVCRVCAAQEGLVGQAGLLPGARMGDLGDLSSLLAVADEVVTA